MAFPQFDFGIPKLRQQAIWSQPQQQGYDWSQPNVDYSAGEMPQMQVNMPPPSVGPVQDTPFQSMFGNATVPTDPTAAPTIAPQASSGQAGMGAPRQITPMGEADSLRRFTGAVNSVYSPDFTDRDRLRALMDAAPEREEPGFARRMVAAGMGFRQKPEDTLKIQDAVMYAPHRQAMQDWTAKTEPFTKIAEIEGRQNVNERTLAGNMVNAVTQGDRIEQARIRDEGKQQVAEEKAKSERIRAESQVVRDRAYAAKNNGATVHKAGDRYIGVFPDGRKIDIGPSGGLDRETELDIMGEWKVEANKALGAGWAKDPDGNWHRTNARDTDVEPPPRGSVPITGTGGRSSAGKEDTPAEAEKRQTMEWRKLRDTDPDVKAWTTVKGNGKIELKDEPTMGSWFQTDESDQKDIDAFNRAKAKLYPGTGAEPSTTPPPPVKPTSTTGLGPTRETVSRAAAPPPPKEAEPRVYYENGVKKFRESVPDPQSYVDDKGVRQFPKRRTADKFLPAEPGQRTPAHTEEELGQQIDRQQKAVEILRSQGKRVTQANIDFVISTGAVR